MEVPLACGSSSFTSSVWQLVFSKKADKQLSKMDPSVRRDIYEN